MLITQRAEIFIDAEPSRVWDVLNDADLWMASNPEEHFGTRFFTPDRRARSGASFEQRESVAGVRADMKGHFLHVERPNHVSWTGVAEYRLLGGLIKYRIPQSGIVKLERRPEGLLASHDMFIDFPDTWIGKAVAWYFRNVRDGERLLREHGQKELVYFKKHVEGWAGSPNAVTGTVTRRSANGA